MSRMEELFNDCELVSKKNISNELRQELIEWLGDIDEWDDRPYKTLYMFENSHIIIALERELSQTVIGCRKWIFTKDGTLIMPPMECRMELN
jgi:hypothetical protein